MHDPRIPAKEQLTCRDIMRVYIWRAIHIQARTNCLAQVCFQQALHKAQLVDERIQRRRAGTLLVKPLPLEGIPISVKDDYDVRGLDTTCGMAVRCGEPYKHNGLMVDLVCDQGAIPFCKSNVPQSLMAPESMSAAWGRTSNPFNSERTSGGSSGGEASLLASGGSPLGLGSDIGGSARAPAHFCGLYAFKATPARLSLQGTGEPGKNHESGQVSVRAACGILGHNVDSLVRVMQAWCSDRMWKSDVQVPRVPLQLDVIYRSVSSSRGPTPRIGFYEDDGYFAASGACQRSVRESVDRLRKAGYECVPFPPPLRREAVGAYFEIMSADDAASMIGGLEGEELDKAYNSILLLTKVPRFLTSAIASILRLVGEQRMADLLTWCRRGKSAAELHTTHIQQQRCIDAYLAQMQKLQVDLVICPGHALPAFPHGTSQDLMPSCASNFVYNLLGFPVGSVPVTRVDPTEVDYQDPQLLTRNAREVCRNSVGMPVGIQIVARPWHDEQILALMHTLEVLTPASPQRSPLFETNFIGEV